MGRVTTRFSVIWLARVVIALLAFCVALFIEWDRPPPVQRLDESLRDFFVRHSASEQPETRLVIVDISESSLQKVGPWPWPRHRLADLVEILLENYGARAVGLDIVFTEPGDAQGDARLAALATHSPLTLAQILDYTPRSPAIRQGVLAGGLMQGDASGLTASGYIANHAGLAGARCVGNIGYVPDPDGVLRHTPLRTSFEGKNYPHFAEAMIDCANKLDSLNQTSPFVTGKGIPDVWRIPYSKAPSAYTVVSAYDILLGDIPPNLVRGRYVLVGSSALSLGDHVSTPHLPLSSGVMVHAANLSGLLDLIEGQINPPWQGYTWLFFWILVSTAVAMAGIAATPAWGGLMVVLTLATGWTGLAYAATTRQAEWSVTAPLWAYFFLLLVAVPHEWWQAQRRTRRVLNTLSHYVAQPVLDEIVRLNLQYSLKPMLCEVTVLIADMEGYTRATSSLSLEDAAALTKDFLACLTRPVLAWHGTLDKYTGDGLVAFWGAPLPCVDQADRAVSAALAILAEVEALNARRHVKGYAPVQVRIGIESGSALVGDLGTPFRSTYTAVGDCINFASRLEAAARDLPTQLVVGPDANAKLTKFSTLSLGQIALRGTQTTIEVFTVLKP